MSILRPVSGLERLWLVAGRLAPPFAIHLIVEPDGPVDAARWTAAVEQTAAAHPGLTARLTGTLKSTRWIATEHALPVRLVDEAWSGDRPTPWLDAPFAEAFARVHLLPDRVVFSAHHALTDGRGLWTFVDDVVRVLGGEAPLGAEGGPTVDADLARALSATAPKPPEADMACPFADPPTVAEGITWRRRALPPGPNVVARVVAAVAATTDAPKRIGVPVDLRRHRPGLRSTANLTGVAHLDVPTPDPTAIRAALDAALGAREAAGHALGAEVVRGLPLWLMTGLARRLTRRERGRGRYPTSASVSSLGRHALALDGRPIRVAFVPPGAPGLPLFVGLCGTAERIELTASSPRAFADDGRLDALLSRIAAGFRASA